MFNNNYYKITRLLVIECKNKERFPVPSEWQYCMKKWFQLTYIGTVFDQRGLCWLIETGNDAILDKVKSHLPGHVKTERQNQAITKFIYMSYLNQRWWKTSVTKLAKKKSFRIYLKILSLTVLGVFATVVMETLKSAFSLKYFGD